MQTSMVPHTVLGEEMPRKPTAEEKLEQVRGLRNSQNVFWAWYSTKNFGDWITPFLYERYTGEEAVFCRPKELKPPASTVFGAGSILGYMRFPNVVSIWGSGIIRRDEKFSPPLNVFAVRGPFTRQRILQLGYDCPEVYGDPGLLMSEFLDEPSVPKIDVGFVPHFVDLPRARKNASDLPAGWEVISPVGDPLTVASNIANCRMIISSSLHGIIVAHSMGIPTIWVKSEKPLHGDNIKFLDHHASMDIDVGEPAKLIDTINDRVAPIVPDATRLRSLKDGLRKCCPFLTS